MKELDELKENYNWEQLQNCIRFNGVLDIYRRKKGGKISMFNIPEQEWYYPDSALEMIDYATSHLDEQLERPTFKKTKKGNMTYQEFKHRQEFVPLNLYRKSTRYMDDKTPMPWGKYQGTAMANIPADYLIWIFENNKCGGEVLKYIRVNEENLRQEIKQAKNSKR